MLQVRPTLVAASLALSACSVAPPPKAPAEPPQAVGLPPAQPPLLPAVGLPSDGAVYADGDHYGILTVGDLAATVTSADSEANALPASAVADGDLATPWANAGYRQPTAWVQLGWGAVLPLTGVRLKTGPSAPGTSYDVLVSPDGSAWTTVLTHQTNIGWQMESRALPTGTTGGFLRILFHNSATAPIPRFSVFELAVQGGSGGTVPAATPTPTAPGGVPPNAPPTSAPVYLDLPATRPAVVSGGPPLLPDLAAMPPVNLWLQRAWGGGGSIHFSNTIANRGQGPFVVSGSLEADGIHTDASQELLDSNGRIVAVQDIGLFAYHPTHHHFHVADVSLYELRSGGPTGPVVSTSKKVSFCLDDSLPITNPAPKANYRTCTPVVQGLDPGWADLYPGNLDGQSLDVGGIAAGTYYLVITVDPTNKFADANRNDNVAWLKVGLDSNVGRLDVLGNSAGTP